MASDFYWRIDGDASLQIVLEWPDCPALLRQALTGALAWQTRNEILVGRALRSPRVPPQWLAVLLALGARVVIEEAGGAFPAPLQGFLQRQMGGKLVALEIPVATGPASGVVWGEARVARTPADEPIVTAVAWLRMDGSIVGDARLALTGAWPEPARLAAAAAQLAGGALEDASIASVACAVQDEVAPPGDYLGSAEYRRAMTGVLTRRALQRCREQLGGVA